MFVVIHNPEGFTKQDDLWLYNIAASEWQKASTTCTSGITTTKENNTLIVPVCHLTQFALFRESDATAVQQTSKNQAKTISPGILAVAVILPVMFIMCIILIIIVIVIMRRRKEKVQDIEMAGYANRKSLTMNHNVEKEDSSSSESESDADLDLAYNTIIKPNSKQLVMAPIPKMEEEASDSDSELEHDRSKIYRSNQSSDSDEFNPVGLYK